MSAPDERTIEQKRDQEMQCAFYLLYDAGTFDEQYTAKMMAAQAHATLAAIYQSQLSIAAKADGVVTLGSSDEISLYGILGETEKP